MATQILITDRKVFNQYANGDDFSLNTSDIATYLRGGVMGVQQAVYTIEIEVREIFSQNSGNLWTVDGNQLNRNLGSWIDEGFSIGDTIDLFLGQPPSLIFAGRTITNITDTDIFFDGTAVVLTSSDVSGDLRAGKTDLFALEYSYGIINNDDVASYKSLLDNTDQTYYADNIGVDNGGGRDTSFVEMTPKNNSIQSWVTTRPTNTQVRFIDRPSTYVQRFEIKHEYIIIPYNVNVIQDNLSLKYISKFDFRTNLANINTAKITEDDIQLGSVGWFDENYNGYNNEFTIDNLTYTDVNSSSLVTELNIKSKTRVNFTIMNSGSLFNSSDPIVIYHSYIPEFNVYNRSQGTFRSVWKFDSKRNIIDSAAESSTIIKDFTATFNTPNEIDIQFDIEIPLSDQIDLEEGFEYKIAVEVGDGDLSNQTKNVTLLIDSNKYSSDNNITGLIISNNDEGGFAPYWKFISPTNQLFSTYKGWIEDGIVSYRRFGVNRDVLKDAEILSASFKLVAYEDSTGETFDLQSEQLDLSQQLISPPGTVNANPFTIQLINDERTRGYNLPLGDEFNLLLFETKDNDGTYQYYEWRVGFKMNWQYWISLPNADSIFINTSDTFNGLNNRASNYSLKNGWSIRVLWEFNMQGLDDEGNIGETEYKFFTEAFDIFDFDEQDNDPTTWDCEIFTFDSQGNNLGGKILQNEYTNVKAIFTPQPPYIIDDILPYWGELRIAEQLQPGFNNDVLSTSKPIIDNNRLIPLNGESFASISLVSNTIEIDGRVDFTKIKKNIGYKLSARLSNQDEPIQPIQWVFTTENDISVETFDPSFITSGGEVVTWTLKQGSNYTTNSLNIPAGTPLVGDELNGTCQDVIVTFSTNNPLNIDEINFIDDQICDTIDLSIFENLVRIELNNNSSLETALFPSTNSSIVILNLRQCNLTATLDLSGLSALEGVVRIDQNPLLTSILFPNSTGLITNLFLNDCNLTGSLDLSGLNLSGNVFVSSNPNLTSVTFKPSTSIISIFNFTDCNITGVFDVSMLDNLSSDFRAANNPLLTSISFPTNNNVFTIFRVNKCNLNVLDLSTLTGIGTLLVADQNPNMTSLLLPSSSEIFTQIFIGNCDLGYVDFTVLTGLNDGIEIFASNNNMIAEEVNHILVDLDNKGWVNGEVFIAGSNAAPDGVSGGFDGLTAKSNLILKGWVVTTN